jgi:hypothetical protein
MASNGCSEALKNFVLVCHNETNGWKVPVKEHKLRKELSKIDKDNDTIMKEIVKIKHGKRPSKLILSKNAKRLTKKSYHIRFGKRLDNCFLRHEIANRYFLLRELTRVTEIAKYKRQYELK